MAISNSIVQYSLTVQGTPLSNTVQVTRFSIKVNKLTAQGSEATLYLLPQINAENGEVSTHADLFRTGHTVQISAGDGTTLTSLFSGKVRQYAFQANSLAQQVIVLCAGTAKISRATARAGSPLRVTYGENCLEVELTKSKGIKGKLTVQGSHLYTPGASLVLGGMDKTFNGRYRIATVEHQFADDNWISALHVNRT